MPETCLSSMFDIVAFRASSSCMSVLLPIGESIKYNKKHKITPKTIIKKVEDKQIEITSFKHVPKPKIKEMIVDLETKMKDYAENLDFESAIQTRDKLAALQKELEA